MNTLCNLTAVRDIIFELLTHIDEVIRDYKVDEIKEKYKGVVAAPISQCGERCVHWDHNSRKCGAEHSCYADLPCQQRRKEMEEAYDKCELPYPATWREKSKHAKSRQATVQFDSGVGSVGTKREDPYPWWS